jgi:hypothetical protein
VLVALILFFEAFPTFKWKTTLQGIQSRMLVKQGRLLRFVYKLTVVLMGLANLGKAVLLGIFFFDLDLNSQYLSYIIDKPIGTVPKENQRVLFKQLGLTLAIESLLMVLVNSNIQSHTPLVLSARDVIFWQSRLVREA